MAHTQINLAVEKCRKEILTFLLSVTKSNFWSKYDELASIVISYKEEITIDEMDKLMLEILKTSLDENQNEVVLEIANRIEGYCPLGREIYW
jgi:hypothetical protein